MQFVYDGRAGQEALLFEGDSFAHLVKSRRSRVGEALHVRNLQEPIEYVYQLESISRNKAHALLKATTPLVLPSLHSLSVGWAMVEQKTVEKALPMLNEMGVRKIVFVKSDYAQGNVKMDFARLERMVISSCQQCGRSDLLVWEESPSVAAWLEANPEGVVVDFSPNRLGSQKPTAFLVGCEGGFSPKERALFEKRTVVGLDSPYILRSESAVVAMASKILT
ncbi:MAG: 16S rRNA (uracil(1498)-N(3))-methyltransferase [Campylobacterales bacterium]|nr:16S rRNA (uracil(1498)-N(3))-methyltransferase [Campylobacterales bacterium]